MTEATNVLLKILNDKVLLGGTGNIKGAYKCVCFTETPIAQLALSLANRAAHQFKYRAAGIMVDKKWAFEHGARPAIYQTEEEFFLLPDEVRYRHVRFEPFNEVDFTWEREWRLQAEQLAFTPDEITLIVPNRRWADIFTGHHIDKVKTPVPTQGAAAVTRPPWHIIALSDLGIDVPDEIQS